jgi:PiT family inorganic phosphate transporter
MVLEGISFGGQTLAIPLWVLLVGGLGMSFGIMLLGHKVMATLGHKITLITNSKGFCIDFSTATTVTLASILGMPVSTTHAATGSVVGVGLEKGLKGINLSLFIKIFAAWVITLPCAASITIALFYLFKGIGKIFS